MLDFCISTKLNAARLAREYKENGRVRINDFLDRESADQLLASLNDRQDWSRVFFVGDQVMNVPRAHFEKMLPADLSNIEASVYASARDNFQFRYESIRVPDALEDRTGSNDPLAAFALFLSQGVGRDFVRRVTGRKDIEFADAQATAYSPGDFLTRHNDEVAGKNRRAAYVYGLNQDWHTEWGGLLLFHHPDGQRARAYVPGFNVLNLFKVPLVHSVSEVSKAAPRPRYSITGWLRGV